MVGTHFTKDRDDGVSVLAGIDPPSSLRSAWADNVISFPTLSPPPWAGDDEDADCWESVGILAVKIVGNFDLPRLRVLTQDQREVAYRDPGSSDR
jgi:hypothetical protein